MFRSQNWIFRLAVVIVCVACAACSLHPLGVTATGEPEALNLTTKVHNSPYFSSAIIGQMENGTEITVQGEIGDFYIVDCYDMIGYIAKTQVERADGKSYVNCDPNSEETGTLDYVDHAAALKLRYDLFELAKKQLGDPYVYGGSRPGAFDCSGLMYYLFGQHDIQLNRTASAQMQNGIIVAKEGLQVGDLIFFREYGEVTLASHVGIYVGNNQIIHSGSNGVEYADLDFDYFDKFYLCARRIVNTDASILEQEDTAAAPVAAPVTSGRRTR